MHHHRQLWRGLAEITQAADLPPSAIFDALGVWYSTSQTAAVRRQVDRTRGVVSLVRLLEDVARHPGAITRERHIALWESEVMFKAEAHANFDRFSGGRQRDRIDVALVRADVATLNAAGRAVENFVNETVAHAAETPQHEVPTFMTLNAAIDTIGELARKYASLLKAEMLVQLEPVIQYDWKAPFRQAWIAGDDD